ncbi:glomulin-like [Tubulanus polymorphus]|uniref:glomulin-like n=1 Tax=Tubulanus polymorphus TaxID=672921 RepID=UPI003DA31963
MAESSCNIDLVVATEKGDSECIDTMREASSERANQKQECTERAFVATREASECANLPREASSECGDQKQECSEHSSDPTREERQNIFIADLQQMISKREICRLNATFYADENKTHLESIGWDLVPVLCSCLTERNNRKRPKLVDFCEQALVHLARTGNAKELLLGLLEQADSFKDDVKFKTLLHAIQTVLLRLPTKRQYSLEMTLETLYAHILCLELPSKDVSANLETNEKKILDSDPKILRIGDVISALLTFLKPFVNEAKPGIPKPGIPDQRKLVVRYLLKLLNHPLVFLDLTVDENGTKSLVRVMSELLIKYVTSMCADLHRAITWMSELVTAADDAGGYRNEENDLELGVACFVYLIHGERMHASLNYPSVLRAEFVFLDSLPYAVALLQRSEPFVVAKGVRIVDQLIAEIAPGSVSYDWLDNDDFTQCVRLLAQCVIRCSARDVRQTALRLFPKQLSKFDSRGKNSFIYYLLNISHHAGFTGFVIQLLKQEIDSSLRRDDSDDSFSADKLPRFYSNIFTLADGATTDLLEHSDAIMAALNLLRYLVLRDDPNVNATAIWNYVANLTSSYMEPLLTGIEMSRAHYELELRGLKGEASSLLTDSSGNKDSDLTSVTVGGLPLPRLPKDQQMNIVTTALHTFDMMQSVVVRVQEIIDSHKQQTSNNS